MKQQAIGFLGGSFDPIHNGHLLPAVEVAQRLQLKTLFLMPNHIAPHKTGSHCSAKQRSQMVELAVQDISILQVDKRELNRDSASYTVETLKEIKEENLTTPLCFVMGMDSLINFNSWYRWQHILNYCHLIICARPGWTCEFNETIQALLKEHQTTDPREIHSLQSGKIYFQDTTQFDISSTQIRYNLVNKINVKNTIPTPVYNYIKQHQLYC